MTNSLFCKKTLTKFLREKKIPWRKILSHSDIVFSVETVFHQFWTSLEKVWTVFYITCHQLMVNLFGTISMMLHQKTGKRKRKNPVLFLDIFSPRVNSTDFATFWEIFAKFSYHLTGEKRNPCTTKSCVQIQAGFQTPN